MLLGMTGDPRNWWSITAGAERTTATITVLHNFPIKVNNSKLRCVECLFLLLGSFRYSVHAFSKDTILAECNVDMSLIDVPQPVGEWLPPLVQHGPLQKLIDIAKKATKINN